MWCDICLPVGTAVMRQQLEEPKRILIIDDEEGFRDGVADLLGMEGYAVSVARNAVEAVRILPEFRPDLILLDLRMPHLDGEGFLRGMTGLEASKRVPVVLISAHEDLAALAGGAARGMPACQSLRSAWARRSRVTSSSPLVTR